MFSHTIVDPPPSPFRLIAIGAAVLAECPRFVASIHILLFVRGSISGPLLVFVGKLNNKSADPTLFGLLACWPEHASRPSAGGAFNILTNCYKYSADTHDDSGISGTFVCTSTSGRHLMQFIPHRRKKTNTVDFHAQCAWRPHNLRWCWICFCVCVVLSSVCTCMCEL